MENTAGVCSFVRVLILSLSLPFVYVCRGRRWSINQQSMLSVILCDVPVSLCSRRLFGSLTLVAQDCCADLLWCVCVRVTLAV